MSAISARLTEDVKKALKEHDARRLETIRFVLAQVKNLEIERRSKDGAELSELDFISVVRRLISQERETIEFLKKDNRADAVEEEEAKIKVLESYLPQALNQQEVDLLIDSTLKELGSVSSADFGRIMKELVKRAAGRVESGILSSALKNKLN